MPKELRSGIKVDADVYYQLLDWKDKNMKSFEWFLQFNAIETISINDFTLSEYKNLLIYSKI